MTLHASSDPLMLLATDHSLVVCARRDGEWQSVRGGLAGHHVTAVTTQNGVIVAGTRDGAHGSEDGGLSWTQAGSGLTIPLVRWVAAHPDVPGRVLAGTEPAGIFVWDDGSWHECPRISALRDEHGWFCPTRRRPAASAASPSYGTAYTPPSRWAGCWFPPMAASTGPFRRARRGIPVSTRYLARKSMQTSTRSRPIRTAMCSRRPGAVCTDPGTAETPGPRSTALPIAGRSGSILKMRTIWFWGRRAASAGMGGSKRPSMAENRGRGCRRDWTSRGPTGWWSVLPTLGTSFWPSPATGVCISARVGTRPGGGCWLRSRA